MIKIVFMGTPDFAIPTLRALYENYEISAVVTKADRPKGRGQKLAFSPVKEFALEKNIPVLQPEKMRDPEFLNALSAFDADLFVTCAYGKILTQEILDMPKHGTINVHAGLLPKYRGAAPLWHMVINGEKEVGVTTMLTDIGMDTGDILLEEKCPLSDDETMGEVHDKLAELGAMLIVKTINEYLSGNIRPRKQSEEGAGYAKMVSKEDGKIDFTKSSLEIHNLIRGMNPFPTAWTTLEGEVFKIFRSRILDEKTGKTPGTIIDSNGTIKVASGDGVIEFLEVQALGGKRMDVKAYLNGHPVSGKAVFGQ